MTATLRSVLKEQTQLSPDYLRIFVGGPIASGKTTIAHVIHDYLSTLEPGIQPSRVFDFDVEKLRGKKNTSSECFVQALQSPEGLILPNCALLPERIKEEYPDFPHHCLMVMPISLYEATHTIQSILKGRDLPETRHKKQQTLLQHALAVAFHALKSPTSSLKLSNRLDEFTKLVLFNFVQFAHLFYKNSQEDTLKRYRLLKEKDIFITGFKLKNETDLLAEDAKLPEVVCEVLQAKVLKTLRNLSEILSDTSSPCYFVPYTTTLLDEPVHQVGGSAS